MKSFLTIELDTTPPIIDIHTSSHVFQGELLEVVVESNKSLDDWHEVYIIDSNGNRHSYNFNINEDKAYGLINFNKLPFGLATLSLVFRDSVWNKSDKYTKKITVKNSNQLMYLTVGDLARSNDINEYAKTIDTNEYARDNSINEHEKSIDINEHARKNDIANKDRNK